ncbi:hypothetical protein THAOC_15652 [Thalassiosira oceanica]|uniref:Uncharacterized protein n=1 Tax=Thalassiosira oceanica TaxID=159749 RepID=K0SFE8_THAOC|nr:hypothetical protein THAOC_15652 [Thalassiosira oceanica]|eukprot:EJK63679.1 hypothetical protein THAOC_15652 [Thalassiosira oceanica]
MDLGRGVELATWEASVETSILSSVYANKIVKRSRLKRFRGPGKGACEARVKSRPHPPQRLRSITGNRRCGQWPILAGGAPWIYIQDVLRGKTVRRIDSCHPLSPSITRYRPFSERSSSKHWDTQIQISYSSAAILTVEDGTIAAVDAAAGLSQPAPSMALKMANFQRTIYAQPRRRVTAILDFVITDTDAPSYGHQPSKKVLEKAAKRKKDKYLEACRERRRDFIPMAYSVDGLAGKEARAAEKRLASLLASKWDRPYSEMACFVKTRMSLSIVRSISMLLRGSRSSAWKRRAPDDGVAARASVTSQRW